MKNYMKTLSLLSLLLITPLAAMAETAPVAAKAVVKSDTVVSEKQQKIEEALQGFSEEKRALVKAALEAGKVDYKASREKTKALREEIQKILVAPTFDKKAYLAKSKEMNSIMADIHAKRANRIADVAEKLSAEERAKLVEVMKKSKVKMHSKHQDEKGGSAPQNSEVGAPIGNE